MMPQSTRERQWHYCIGVRAAKLKAYGQFGAIAVYEFTHVNRERLTRLAEWVDQNNKP